MNELMDLLRVPNKEKLLKTREESLKEIEDIKVDEIDRLDMMREIMRISEYHAKSLINVCGLFHNPDSAIMDKELMKSILKTLVEVSKSIFSINSKCIEFSYERRNFLINEIKKNVQPNNPMLV